MARLVSNSPSIQITIFGNITSSLLESLGTNDITALIIPINLKEIYNQGNIINTQEVVSI